ncbi:MAG: ATP-binding protein [Bacillota bacterium]|nr:ATP-binding protein [Bacillota bacterium]
MFIGRSFEIEQLNKLCTRPGFKFAILYGRRKVGKTALIKEFTRDKETLFYIPEEHNEYLALNSFRDMILKHFKLSSSKTQINSWEDAFRVICEEAKDKRIVVVLDEFPYLAQENPSISSIIQKVIEGRMKESQIFLIISGSSSSLMEKELLSSKGGLSGLRTAQFQIEPLNFFESAGFFPQASIIDKIKYYSTLGGMPQYLSQFNYSRNYDSNVIEFLLNKSSYLYDEPACYLKPELEDLKTAGKILSLLSTGDFNLDRLSEKNFFMCEDLVYVIKKLKGLNLISMRKSIGRSERRPWSVYRLEDNFFRFWYRFLYKNRGLIDMGMMEYLYQNKIMKELNSHVGYIFEDICLQFLKKLNSGFQLPFVFEAVGSWIGYNPLLKKPAQMDITATSGDNILIGECKWNGTAVRMNTVLSVIEKARTLKYANKFYCFFSRTGYSDEVIKFSINNPDIFLFSLSDIEKLL